MRIFLFLGFFLSLSFISLHAIAASQQKGKIYALNDEKKEKLLFLFKRTIKYIGANAFAHATFTYPDGKPAVEESVEYENDILKKYHYKQLQVDESGSAEIKNGKIYFHFIAQGKEEYDDEDLEENTIVSDMISPMIEKRWQEIEKEDTIKVRYILVERLETIGFKFFKEKDITYKNKKALEIIMKPSSFFIAALTSPIRFLFEKETPHKLLEIHGRLPLRLPEVPIPKSRSDWKAMDGILTIDP